MRNKLRLQVEELAVESFATAGSGKDVRGTVKGHATWDWCEPPSASQPMACRCMSDEPTADTTCNPNQCPCQPTYLACTRFDC